MQLDILGLTWTMLLVFLLYSIVLIVYRLCYHPLAGFPGPRVAAATHWTEVFYDIFRPGQLTFTVGKWHDTYGPIVRINPDELHVRFDPGTEFEFYDKLYSGAFGAKRDKYLPWCRMTGSLGSTFSTSSHELHRRRREAIAPFFSRAAIVQVETLIRANIAKIIAQLEDASRADEVVNMTRRYFALTMDVILQYAFGEEETRHLCLNNNIVAEEWYETLHFGFESGAMARQFPWATKMAMFMPSSISRILNQSLAFSVDWVRGAEKRVNVILQQSPEQNEMDPKPKTVFHKIRDSDRLPSEEKSASRMVDEARVFLGAGSETTAFALSTITFYLLQNQTVLKRLQKELDMHDARNLSWAKLEQLTYLSAVVAEGLRLSYGVTTRLPRIAVGEQLRYRNWIIPSGTPVSTTQYFILTDGTIFPEPERFKPERWLTGAGQHNKAMGRYLVNFGRGSRQCAGINLAYAEIYMTLADIFSTIDMELFETSREAVAFHHDAFTAAQKPGSRGVQVLVRRRKV